MGAMTVIGFIIGIIAGFVQFLMLFKFTSSVTGGGFSGKSVIYAVIQFLIPLAVLLLCAFVFRELLLPTAIGITVSLVSGAIIRFLKVKQR